MATQTWYNDGGVYRQAKGLWYNDGGTWRQASELWYNDGGTWRRVFGNGINGAFRAWNIDGTSAAGASGTASIVFNSNGTVSYTATPVDNTTQGSTHWYNTTTAGIGSSFWLRATVTAGLITTGTTGSWISLAAGVSYTRTSSAGVAGSHASGTLTFEIASDSLGSTIVFTSTGNNLVTSKT